MAWVAPKDRDSAWWIIKKLYPCKVPNMQTMSADYLKYFGVPDSGDDRINSQMRNEWVEIQIPIAAMANYYAEDTHIKIAPQLTKEIYERIVNHLQLWKREMEESLNPGKMADILDDLIKLDAFAASLFPHAKRFFDHDFIESKFARGLVGRVSISKDMFLTKAQKEEQKPEDQRRHTSFSDAFQERKNNMANRRWK